jgi:ABC-type bacteriocin/lantibiotic exporter with double-glycine peptidase domain
LITRFANFEPAGVLQFLGNYGEMYTSPVFILGTFIYILTELKLWGLFIILALSICLATLNKLNTMQVVRWRVFNSQGNARAIALRELIPNIEEIKKAGQEDFFHKKLNARRGNEMSALKSLHNLSNILGFTFELTFLMGAFMIVVFTQIASEGDLQIGLAFSNIALVNNLRGPFKAMMDLVVNYSEYSLSRVSMH